MKQEVFVMIIGDSRILENGVNVKNHKKITEVIKNILDTKIRKKRYTKAFK